MKTKIIAGLFLLLFSGIALSKESIPNQFQGLWGSAQGCKAVKITGVPDDGAKITDSAVTQYEYGCDLKQVKTTGKTKFTGQFACSSPDGETSETISLAIAGKGKLSINGQAAVPKCK